MSSFFKDRRWEIVLHRKIALENNNNLRKQPFYKEEYISEIFKESGFSSISSFDYKVDNKKGEIDIIAYKEDTIFILELKSTYVEEDLLKTSKYETHKFNSKASEQLNKAKNFIEKNFNALKKVEGLNISCRKQDLKIITIIISNIYQSDNLVFNNEHLKISLFELLIILKNDRYKMLHSRLAEVMLNAKFDFPIDSILKMQNQFNNDFKQNTQIKKENCNLWSDITNCSPEDIITAIKESKVWKHQEENRNFGENEEIELKLFSPNYKYLN